MSQSIACNPSGTASGAAKTTLRASLLAARKNLTDRAGCDLSMACRLQQWLAQHAPRCVGFYWPTAGEFDARGVIADWLAADPLRRAALPVVVGAAAPLVFHAWQADATMRPGRYGIAVPADGVPCQPDVILIPCVGFDSARFRLGYGGGYYDRTLAARRQKSPQPGAAVAARAVPASAVGACDPADVTGIRFAVGLAYECGHVDRLPLEAHDIPLDTILSEAATY